MKKAKKTKTSHSFKIEGQKPKDRKDLENRHRNGALSEDCISLEEKERDVQENLNEDTQPEKAA